MNRLRLIRVTGPFGNYAITRNYDDSLLNRKTFSLPFPESPAPRISRGLRELKVPGIDPSLTLLQRGTQVMSLKSHAAWAVPVALAGAAPASAQYMMHLDPNT